ncbi:hypothetical protein COLO4_09689 [Corchorus olitorius]|uniref:Uncharacterized protein n=1 Tax=Corchorus olitorius TaxID=93759 RepID=A0A1R3KBA8_9ROSI|nr:hypothetical protein COLO4_09689 [Corchorus olitorius]
MAIGKVGSNLRLVNGGNGRPIPMFGPLEYRPKPTKGLSSFFFGRNT